MKTTRKAFVLLIMLISNTVVNSQEISLKFGKVTKDELDMSVYNEDTTASAVVLNKNGYTYYTFIREDFKVEYNYETKIKILKSEGTGYANVAIPFYQSETSNLSKEQISKIEAYAYNLEDGKIVKTKMGKEYIFEERLSPNAKQIKFSIPSVKAGTVIEYKYKVISDFFYSLSTWDIQQSIPVANARYEIIIPEYYKFSIASKGFENIQISDDIEQQLFSLNLGKGRIEKINSASRKLIFTSKNIPALKDDNNIWCVDDYTSGVTFELQGIQYPGALYKPYTTNWEDIEETLKKNELFGSNLSLKNPYPEEVKLLTLLTPDKTEKIRTLFQFLKSKISWNGKYALYSNDIKKAIKNGTGTNADFNFILLSILKDAGITAYPVLLSHRSMGRLPLTHPSINKLNTFIVGAQNTDSTMVYMDGSIIYGDLNILPPSLMVDQARVMNTKGNSYWVNLTNVGKNSSRSIIQATVDENGSINGTMQRAFEGQFAADINQTYYSAKDSISFIEKLQAESEIEIESYESSGHRRLTDQVKDKVTFNKSATVNDNYIYLNPMIFPHITQNYFIQEERKLPVEFKHLYTTNFNIVLNIPTGYLIEEIPQSTRFAMEDGSMRCAYNITQNGQQVILNYTLHFDKIIFTQMEYPILKRYWEMLIKKNTEQIVLKKI